MVGQPPVSWAEPYGIVQVVGALHAARRGRRALRDWWVFLHSSTILHICKVQLPCRGQSPGPHWCGGTIWARWLICSSVGNVVPDVPLVCSGIDARLRYGLCLLNIAAHRRARRPRRAADYHPREILSSSSKSVPAPCRHILRSDMAAAQQCELC